MKRHIIKSDYPFKINPETLEVESEFTIKEGELPKINKIWIEEIDETT